MVCGHCLVTLSLTINETLKWLSVSLPILMQESFWWWQCGDRYIDLSPSSPTSITSFSPSLISFLVSVGVKHHHVYSGTTKSGRDWRKEPEIVAGSVHAVHEFALILLTVVPIYRSPLKRRCFASHNPFGNQRPIVQGDGAWQSWVDGFAWKETST